MSENNNYEFNKNELLNLVDDVIKKYDSKSSNYNEVINYKLDSIENQTTRTNGRLTELERKVQEIEKDGAHRIATCPQADIIARLHENSITVNTMKKLVIRGITIAGIFFTILFGLLRLIMNGNIIIW